MKQEKYVAYVGTYTHEHSMGIHIYDLDVEQGRMKEHKMAKINNPSDLIVSNNKKYLYSITDDGVKAFKILPTGDLEPMNEQWIGGMRGCYLDLDESDRFLFVAGYHDGRVSMMHLNPDGTVGEIADGVFHKGVGRSAADRSSRPHVNCVKVTPDQGYLCAVDGGLDHVKVYKIDYEYGKLRLADIIRCDLDSAPKMIRFSKDGKNAYVLNELKNTVDVYKYTVDDSGPVFDRIQSISTKESNDRNCAAQNMEFSRDGNYLYCSNAGTNEIVTFAKAEDGTLSEVTWTQISGDFPKALAVFPDGNHFMSLNHESNQISIFKMYYDKGYALMDGKPMNVERPNCVYIHKLSE
ncbi:MAG: beta-propeller fold lactonase family protein [Roseburia sp.]|nr:beta-propeller fold lactonase family protein [Roseburia sp.]